MGTRQSRFTLILVAIIAAASLILVAGLVVWYRQNVIISDIIHKRQEMSAQVDKINQELATLDDKKAELADLKTKLADLDQNLTDYKFMPTYLKQLQRATIVTGNKLQSIQPSPIRALDLSKLSREPEPAKPAASGPEVVSTAADHAAPPAKAVGPTYMVQRINLDVRGNYTSFVKLLDALRQFPKLIYVRALTISPPTKGADDTMGAQIETYAIIIPDQYKQAGDGRSLNPLEASR